VLELLALSERFPKADEARSFVGDQAARQLPCCGVRLVGLWLRLSVVDCTATGELKQPSVLLRLDRAEVLDEPLDVLRPEAFPFGSACARPPPRS
jgi:hypothetical protein